MAFVNIEDFTGSLELVIFSDCYEKTKNLIRVDGVVLASGRISTREGQAAKLIASNILPLDRLSEFFDCRLVVDVDRRDYERLPQWWGLLQSHPGSKEVILVTRNNGEELLIRPRNLRVKLDGEFVEGLKEALGESNAYLAPAGSM